MLLGFALSGLQEFIYDLMLTTPSRQERTAEGGRDTDAARRLRLRSAVLTLIPGLVLYEAKRHDDGAEAIYLGGGKLLLKATEAATAQTSKKLHELYEWLAERSAGRLSAYWALHDGNDDSKGIVGLLEKLNEAKWRAGRPSEWHGLSGAIREGTGEGALGDRNWESDEGAKLAKGDDGEQWVGFLVDKGGWRVGPWQARMVTKNPDIAIAGMSDAKVVVSIPTFTPKKDGETITLHDLAEFDESGAPRPGGAYLALVKLDGDGIGLLMKRALQQDPDGSAYRRVSKDLSKAFGPTLVEFLKNRYPRLYLVYSGGDDLVAAGHFWDVLGAASDIRREFSKLDPKLSGGKPPTVSAGIAFFTRNAPILRAIETADEALEHAKETHDAVSAGGCRLSWQEFDSALREVDGLVDAIQSGSIPRGALTLLRQLGKFWIDGSPQPRSEPRWRSIPMFHYMRSRRAGWHEDEWSHEVRALFDSLSEREDGWRRAAFVGTLASWRTKIR